MNKVVAILLVCLTGVAAFAAWNLAHRRPAELTPSTPASAAIAPTSTTIASSRFRFEDITENAGIDFTHFSGISPRRYQPETTGSGVALVDYDGNGLLDIYFLTGCPLPLDPQTPSPGFRMYSQQSPDKFVEVSAVAGVVGGGYGQGVAVGDFDNDGFADLYVTRCGSNLLLQSNGDGTLSELPACAGADDPAWSTGCAWFDADADGNLDLYVANYCDWSPATQPACREKTSGRRTYCHPRDLRPIGHSLFRNDGKGGFENITRAAGIVREDGRGFGVVAIDVNDDRYTDLYIANDTTPNHLYINQAGRGFADRTDDAGAAYDNLGAAQAGMGVDAEDVDGDGLPELFVTNFYLEKNTLYRNLGSCLFADVTDLSGVGAGSLNVMGWATALADFDGDDWPDIFTSNGHLDEAMPQVGMPYAMPARMWRNAGQGRFQWEQQVEGAYFEKPHPGRAAAIGDLDNDGSLDLCLNHLNEPATLLLNRSAPKSQSTWRRVELIGRRTNRDGVGAVLELSAADRKIVRQRKGGGSFLSANDSRLLICIASEMDVKGITLNWPSGMMTFVDTKRVGDLRFLEPLSD